MALILLMVLSIMGTAAMVVTTTDLKISDHYRTSVQTLYAAESGIAEALERLRGTPQDAEYVGDPGTSIDPFWSAYILTSTVWQLAEDPGYNGDYKNYIPISGNHTNTAPVTNSLQTSISYMVKIRHKREYDAEQAGHAPSSPHYYDGDGDTSQHSIAAPGNVIYYGYGDPTRPTQAVQFSTAGTTRHKPVEIITAYADVNGSKRALEIDATYNPGPRIDAAIYSERNILGFGHGGGIHVDGNDACGEATAKPSIATLPTYTTTLTGDFTTDGNPANPIQSAINQYLTGYIDSLKNSATEIITEDEDYQTYGSAADYEVCYSDTWTPYNFNGLKLTNVTGYGILVVKGDLWISDRFNWNGVIVVTGVINMTAGHTGININGAVLAGRGMILDRNITVAYNSCINNNAFAAQSLSILNWKEVW